jgi:hypothetical protein
MNAGIVPFFTRVHGNVFDKRKYAEDWRATRSQLVIGFGRSYTPFWYPDIPFKAVPRVMSGAWSLCRLSGSVSSQWKRPSGPIVSARVLQPSPEK